VTEFDEHNRQFQYSQVIGQEIEIPIHYFSWQQNGKQLF
jgi:hypothetical protein